MLRQAASELREACKPCGKHEAERLLMALRSSTRATRETADEAEASFRVLVAHCAKLPADILRTACTRYVTKPGTAFFPKSPGELTESIGKDIKLRVACATLFVRMADDADEADRERERLAKPHRWSPEDIRLLSPAMIAERTGDWFTQAQVDEALASA